MKEKNIWSSSQSLLVIFDYKNDDQLRDFRKALDKMLSSSQINRLVIVVNVPKEIDKTTLPPHFLIYYHSPNDYTFFGKMKDGQLATELIKNYDLLINFETPNDKIMDFIKTTYFKKKIIINAKNSFFDVSLTAAQDDPFAMLDFITNTLEKIDLYD